MGLVMIAGSEVFLEYHGAFEDSSKQLSPVNVEIGTQTHDGSAPSEGSRSPLRLFDMPARPSQRRSFYQ